MNRRVVGRRTCTALVDLLAAALVLVLLSGCGWRDRRATAGSSPGAEQPAATAPVDAGADARTSDSGDAAVDPAAVLEAERAIAEVDRQTSGD